MFWSVKLTKDVDLDKYKYSGYGIGFGFRLEFSFTEENFEKSIIIFRADMSSYVRIHYKGRDIVIFGERPTQVLDDTTLTTEPKCSINFTQSGKRFLLSPH